MSARRRVPGTLGRRRVRALFLVADPDQPGLSLAERVALTLRRDATIAGRCACGAAAPFPRVRPGEIGHFTLRHEQGCPAADGPHLDRLARRLGSDLRYQHVIVEFEVAA